MSSIINTDLTEIQKKALQDWFDTKNTDLALMLNSFFECVKTHQIEFGDSGDNQHLEQEIRESIQKIKEKIKTFLRIEEGSVVVKSSVIQIFDAKLCFDYRKIYPLIAKAEIQFIHCQFLTTKEDLPIGWEGSGRVFEKKLFFHDCTFGEFVSFLSSAFKETVEFNNSTFVSSVDFHECIFEKNACFYGVDFKGVPNFSQSNFLQKINLVNTNLNFSFEECRKLVENEKKRRIEQREKTLKIGKPITGAQIANDFRVSFEGLKSRFIDNHDNFEADKFHQIAMHFREIELEEKLEKIIPPYFIKKAFKTFKSKFHQIAMYFKKNELKKNLEKIAPSCFIKKNCRTPQKNNLEPTKRKTLDELPIFIEKSYLSLLRQFNYYHISELKIVHVLVFFMAFHFFLITFILFLAEHCLVKGTKNDIDSIAYFLLCSLSAWIVIPAVHYIFSKIKTKFSSQLTSLSMIGGIWIIVFNMVWLQVNQTWVLPVLSVGLVTFYFVCFYILFFLLKLRYLKYAINAFAYILLVFVLVVNPSVLFPILGKFDEVKIENQLLDRYIQKTPLDQLKTIVKKCHFLDQKIDWQHDQYEQIRKIMLNHSEVFLTDASCSNQIGDDFSILVLKNQVLSRAICVVNAIYSIFVVLLLFILGRVVSRRWGG